MRPYVALTLKLYAVILGTVCREEERHHSHLQRQPKQTHNPNGGPPSSNTFISAQYDTSTLHKSFAGASVAAILPALVLFRPSSPGALAHGP